MRKPNESEEQLLRRFRKKVIKARILSEVKRKRFHMTKSEKRRLARRKAVRRARRRQWRSEQR